MLACVDSVIVGERISALRNGLGISQQELGELAGIHFTNIGKIERGSANPTLLTLVRIAAALEIDPGTLIQGLTGDMVPDRPHTVTVSDLIAARR